MITSLEKLIEHLEVTGVLRSASIKNALMHVDRKDFVNDDQKGIAYNDEPMLIAAGQTISQPSTVVFMLEKLNIEKGNNILDIGGGGAWVACLLSYLVGSKGSIHSFEINQEVAAIGRANIEKCGIRNISYTLGNAAEFWHEHAPYDRIHGAAAFSNIPGNLLETLVMDGILVAPTQDGNIRVIRRKTEEKFLEEKYYGFVFVPFVEN